MHATHIIRRPIVTEKASFQTGESNRYTFEVAGTARKDQIKAAVQDLYKVRVLGVSTQNRKARDRQYKYGMVAGAITKRAIVKVHPEDKIELF
jgi:large subunit ribosomal protein L23